MFLFCCFLSLPTSWWNKVVHKDFKVCHRPIVVITDPVVDVDLVIFWLLLYFSFYASAKSDWQAGALCSHVVRSFVRTALVRTSVIKLVNMIFWKRVNRLWCKLPPVIHGEWHKNDQLWGSGGQRSRSNEAEDRFAGLALTGHKQQASSRTVGRFDQTFVPDVRMMTSRELTSGYVIGHVHTYVRPSCFFMPNLVQNHYGDIDTKFKMASVRHTGFIPRSHGTTGKAHSWCVPSGPV